MTLAVSSLAACSAEAPVEDAHGADVTKSTPLAWSVSRHVWPLDTGDPGSKANVDSKELVIKDLDLIASLGAKYVRTDLWWYTVEPSRGAISASALAYYSNYVDLAAARGIKVIAILSNAPDWAKTLYGKDRNAFYQAFENYSARVSEVLGARVDQYQLWNEPNHMIDFVDSEGDSQLFIRGKAGIQKGLQKAGLSSHTFRTSINLLVDAHDSPLAPVGVPTWESDVDFYMQRAKDAVDIITIDHYPGTWSRGDWGGNIIDRLAAKGRRYNKAVGVLETGYATCTTCLIIDLPLVHTDEAQRDWINDQLPKMRQKIASHPEVRFEFANWFKLNDRDTSEPFDAENHFGIVRTDRSPKVGFEALRTQMAAPVSAK